MKFKLKYFLHIGLIVSVFAFTRCSEDEEMKLENDQDQDQNPDTEQPTNITPHDILSSEPYDRMIVEIQYATGFAPPQESIDDMKAFLEARLNKPAGITFINTEIAAPGKSEYSGSDIRAIEEENRTRFSEGNTLAVYFFFADGGYSQDTENSKVLGIAYGSTSMALFQKTIEDFSGNVIGQPSTPLLTSTVMNHEFGHILGLVNNGTPLKSEHQDTAHGKHCNVQECLMYWTAETNQGLEDLLGMSSPPPLDQQCLADLQANGGK